MAQQRYYAVEINGFHNGIVKAHSPKEFLVEFGVHFGEKGRARAGEYYCDEQGNEIAYFVSTREAYEEEQAQLAAKETAANLQASKRAYVCDACSEVLPEGSEFCVVHPAATVFSVSLQTANGVRVVKAHYATQAAAAVMSVRASVPPVSRRNRSRALFGVVSR